jgi:hypothetical protein
MRRTTLLLRLGNLRTRARKTQEARTRACRDTRDTAQGKHRLGRTIAPYHMNTCFANRPSRNTTPSALAPRTAAMTQGQPDMALLRLRRPSPHPTVYRPICGAAATSLGRLTGSTRCHRRRVPQGEHRAAHTSTPRSRRCWRMASVGNVRIFSTALECATVSRLSCARSCFCCWRSCSAS